ncbi:MAG: hypothetical protein ABI675_14275 [Chitinophagaceae bacterium]
MRQINLCIVAALSICTACKQNGTDQQKASISQKSLEDGVEVTVHQQGQKTKLQSGNWLKLQVVQYFNDSILRDSRITGPEYLKYDSSTMTAQSLIAFKNISEGDSLEFKVAADSAFKKNRPGFAKNGGFLITRVKVDKILPDDEAYKKEIAFLDSVNHKRDSVNHSAR